MNLILFPEAFATTRLPVDDPRLQHVRGVLGMQEGDSFDIGVINGPRGKARIEAIDKEHGMTLSATWGNEPEALAPLRLAIGLCRPATARKLLTELTTLGVGKLSFFAAGRSDPAYARSSLWHDEAYRAFLQLGAEQAFHTRLPEVTLTSWEDFLRECSPETTLALDNYEASIALPQALQSKPRANTICLGPERGWQAKEREAFRAQGIPLCHLGARVLRVETAATVASSLWLAASGFWG